MSETPIQFERYELKFKIKESLVAPISEYVEVFCELDPFSERESDKYYTINNLYFDSRNYEFLERKRSDVYDRFNVRVRSYGAIPQFPYFLEIKRKQADIIKKTRARVYGEDWHKVLHGSCGAVVENENVMELQNRELFIRIVHSYDAQPKVLTQYRRKAYASVIDEYARVTFDRDLRYQFETEFNLFPDEKKMNHYDDENIFDGEGSGVILELKCTTRVPLWMMDMIRYFNLNRSSFSKYENGVTETLRGVSRQMTDRVSLM